MGENRPVTSTNLNIRIDGSAGAPAPYEQLRAQIADAALAGRLPVGHKLPTVRGLAEELGLAANTVAKAYRVLEADGVVETRGRHGTFVAAAADSAAREAAAAAQAYAERARRLGLTFEEAAAAALDALRARFDA
ncbi:GntR family transcriptional regulator [Streptomyces globosus]|uniref:GntR family transcriptional regulator n=1 Tax=Streptomyces globosus TaxID=68209 RepID=A0A344U4E4_9ACTN|nr:MULTISPECIES: GntR family transcriptional regulator [Streptomyces]AXE25765.1 GntR family transcriptional regulator [Streptomyces globosus]